VQKSRIDGMEANMNVLSVPPLSFGEKFEDAYEVILILDDREQFATHGLVNFLLQGNLLRCLKLIMLCFRH
jgi:hypothetical protein